MNALNCWNEQAGFITTPQLASLLDKGDHVYQGDQTNICSALASPLLTEEVMYCREEKS